MFHGFDAGYIEPGPSGLITRGKLEILPTGRNFYSLDPFKIPTRGAWVIGKRLADGEQLQPEERLATTSELNPASCLVTGCGEARGMGYWAATQVKGLSPEIFIVPEADVVHVWKAALSSPLVLMGHGEAMRVRRGLRPWHGIKWILWELGRPCSEAICWSCGWKSHHCNSQLAM